MFKILLYKTKDTKLKNIGEKFWKKFNHSKITYKRQINKYINGLIKDENIIRYLH